VFNAAGSATIDAQHRENDVSTIEIQGRTAWLAPCNSGGSWIADQIRPVFSLSSRETGSLLQEPGRIRSRCNRGPQPGNKAGRFVSFAEGDGPLILKVGHFFCQHRWCRSESRQRNSRLGL
jgi:hypothetical protein